MRSFWHNPEQSHANVWEEKEYRRNRFLSYTKSHIIASETEELSAKETTTLTLISLDPLAVSQSSFLHPPQCVKQSVSARINDNNILSYTGFGNNLQIFSQTVSEIGEQEVHIHHTSRSRKFDRSAFKMSGGCRGSHIPILSSAWEFILSECDTPRYMCKLWKEKNKEGAKTML